ncbi:transposase [Streptomyces adustus]|uniref:transposase n=1 Tax=Streptomyces adustus TaxID=1609272 RepID=UPI001EE3AF85|nr:transposase [Streptomyces adustus]
MRIAPPKREAPRVVGIDEFALLRGHRYATIIIDTQTGQRIEVLPDRKAATVCAWLREHPGARVLCRDGAGSSAQTALDANPQTVQVKDRRHLWRGLVEAVVRKVTAHSSCWGKCGTVLLEGKRAQNTRELRQQVHCLLDQGVGLLECSRRLGLAMNTVKRHARHTEPDPLVRTPTYRPGLADPYRDHLRERREKDPAAPVTICRPRSTNTAMRAVRTCWSAPSTPAVSKPTTPRFPHAG